MSINENEGADLLARKIDQDAEALSTLPLAKLAREIAEYPPKRRARYATHARVPWTMIEALRRRMERPL